MRFVQGKDTFKALQFDTGCLPQTYWVFQIKESHVDEVATTEAFPVPSGEVATEGVEERRAVVGGGLEFRRHGEKSQKDSKHLRQCRQ